MPDTLTAARVLQEWLENQTMLFVAAGVQVADGWPPTTCALRGRLALLPDQDVLILKSRVGSFLNLASWGSAESLEMKSDWQGTMINVSFQHESLIIADYEPPPDFFELSTPKSRQRTKIS